MRMYIHCTAHRMHRFMLEDNRVLHECLQWLVTLQWSFLWLQARMDSLLSHVEIATRHYFAHQRRRWANRPKTQTCRVGHPLLRDAGLPSELLSAVHRHVEWNDVQMCNYQKAWCRRWVACQGAWICRATGCCRKASQYCWRHQEQALVVDPENAWRLWIWGYWGVAVAAATLAAQGAGKKCGQLEASVAQRNALVLRKTSPYEDPEVDKTTLGGEMWWASLRLGRRYGNLTSCEGRVKRHVTHHCVQIMHRGYAEGYCKKSWKIGREHSTYCGRNLVCDHPVSQCSISLRTCHFWHQDDVIDQCWPVIVGI